MNGAYTQLSEVIVSRTQRAHEVPARTGGRR